jgi:hypothetical protein
MHKDFSPEQIIDYANKRKIKIPTDYLSYSTIRFLFFLAMGTPGLLKLTCRKKEVSFWPVNFNKDPSNRTG